MTLADRIQRDELWNPYDFANPVLDPHLFAGRRSELQDIRYYLRFARKAPRPINLVLAGPRSAGKTSLLNRIHADAEARDFAVARIDLNEADASTFPLFAKIYDAILLAAVRQGAFGGLEGHVYREYRRVADSGDATGDVPGGLLFPTHFATASVSGRPLSEPTLKADLATISAEVGKPCVLLFDECDVLGKSRVELQLLRNIFMNTKGYMLVFAGTPNLFPIMEDVFSPIVRQFKKVPVERFDEVDDTQACISAPLEQLGIDPEEVCNPTLRHLAVEVHRLAAGRPYEIQLLCHFMFRRVEDGNARNLAVSLDILDDVRAELEKQDSEAGRRSLLALHQLEKSDFTLLQALTEFRGTIEQLTLRATLWGESWTYEELHEAFIRFESLGLLHMDELGTVQFSGDQFDEIYARYYAAANGTSLFIWKTSFRSELGSAALGAAQVIDYVRPIYALTDATPAESRRRVNDALTSLLVLDEGDEGNASALPDHAAALYRTVMAALEFGSITLAALRVHVRETQSETWVTMPSDKVDDFMDEPALVEFNERVDKIGGDLQVEFFSKTTPDRENFLVHVEAVASPNQLEDFAEEHLHLGFEFFQEDDLQRARREFVTATRLHATPRHHVSVAHLSLLLSDWDAAEENALSARSLALESNDLEQYTLATYDLGVALLTLGKAAAAAVVWDEAADVAPHTEKASIEFFLAVPEKGAGGSIAVRQQVFSSLNEGIERARSAIALVAD